MRRLLVMVLSLGILGVAALLSAATPDNGEKAVVIPPAALTARVAKMRAAGMVTEITDTLLKIERKIKDKVESMEFILEKPVSRIKVGDKVRVSYITREDKNVATKVTTDRRQKVKKPGK